jgi:GNAT superfamily N-acetyltransferase
VRVRVLDDPDAFVPAAAPVLASDPAGNTVVATVAEMHRAGPDAPPAWWFVVEDDQVVVGVGMLVPPWPLYVGPMPAGAATLVADAVDRLVASVPGVNGEQEAVREAATRWQRLRPEVAMTGTRGMRLFRLGALTPPDVPGSPRSATEADLDLLRGWYLDFAADADAPTHDVDQSIRFRLDVEGGFVLWEDAGRPVSFAGYTPVVAGVARIGPVYTPPEHRRRGYGAAVTAAASQAARADSPAEVVLFTDLGNPTSNKIYTEIGFRPVRDYLEVELTVG